MARFLAGGTGVLDLEGRCSRPVTVEPHLISDLPIDRRGRGHDRMPIALARNVAGPGSGTGLGTGASDHIENDGGQVEGGDLAGIAHTELDLVCPDQAGLPILGRLGKRLDVCCHDHASAALVRPESEREAKSP